MTTTTFVPCAEAPGISRLVKVTVGGTVASGRNDPMIVTVVGIASFSMNAGGISPFEVEKLVIARDGAGSAISNDAAFDNTNGIGVGFWASG